MKTRAWAGVRRECNEGMTSWQDVVGSLGKGKGGCPSSVQGSIDCERERGRAPGRGAGRAVG